MVPLAAVSVLVGVAAALTMPFTALFLTDELHVSPVRLSVFLLVAPIAGLVANTLLGRLSDARPVRRALLVIGGVAGAGGYALFALVREYWLLLLVSATFAAVASSLMSQTFAYARQALDDGGSQRAPMVISGLRTLFSVAWVIGPPLAAVLVAQTGYAGLFGVTAAVYALTAGVAALWLPGLGAARASATPVAGEGRNLRREMLLAALAFVLLQGASSLGVTAIPLFVTSDLHGTAQEAGFVLGLCAALEIPLIMGLGLLALRFDRRLLVCAGGVAAMLYHAVMLVVTTTWQVLAAQVLSAIAISAVMGIGISFFQDLAPDRPGYATTLYTNTLTLSGMIVAPLIGFAAHLGYRSAYAIALGLCVCGLAVLLLFRPRRG
ncbi:sugar efflux transporter [Umezawaea beigongshangensis]|uniref:sugar efflux transporter n=1 Tax=Umezawaea beigongshangensis TaxID=2780383 RepID=UPI0018F20949|nr:sugar efflux transporter [Umezawaea beigongshangensis]